MWMPDTIVKEIEKVARFRYIARADCELWNAHRRKDELRLLTGWEWIARDGSGRHCQGLKTRTVAYRNAYYELIKGEEFGAPGLPLGRRSLKIVAGTDVSWPSVPHAARKGA